MRLLIDKHALALAHDLLFDLEQALAFQHDREDVARGNVMRVIQLDQFPQERLGGFLLDGIGRGRRRFIDALPIGNEPFALARPITILLLPAGGANIRAAEIRLLIKQQSVIDLFIGKSFAASLTSVPA